MVKVRKVEDIVNEVVRSVKLLEVNQEVNPMKLRNAARVHREDLQRGDFLTKHSKIMMIRCKLLQERFIKIQSGFQNNRHCRGYY